MKTTKETRLKVAQIAYKKVGINVENRKIGDRETVYVQDICFAIREALELGRKIGYSEGYAGAFEVHADNGCQI